LGSLLGLQLSLNENVLQGVQKTVSLFGKDHVVGYYSSYSLKYKGEDIKDVAICCDPVTKEVIAMKSERFRSFQFHPESILSRDGSDILQDSVRALLAMA